MALIVNPIQTKMVLAFQTGTTEDGKAIITKKTYSNVRFAADNEDFLQAANALAGLQNNILDGVYRDNLLLVEED